MDRRRFARAIVLMTLFLAGCATAAPVADPAATTMLTPGTRLLDALTHVADSDATRT